MEKWGRFWFSFNLGVFINTAIEYDASDAGANPSEAISWGKL